MKKSHRHITSLFLTAVYLLVVFTPLAPLAMKSKLVAHAVTGECSGDCSIDGCSLERSAARSCCCWQKKRRESESARYRSLCGTGDTRTSPRTEAPRNVSSCCTASAQPPHGDAAAPDSASGQSPKSTKTAVSTLPCGSGKMLTYWSSDTAQHLPACFSGGIPTPEQTILTLIPPDCLTSRYGEPPDPPPIISFTA